MYEARRAATTAADEASDAAERAAQFVRARRSIPTWRDAVGRHTAPAMLVLATGATAGALLLQPTTSSAATNPATTTVGARNIDAATRSELRTALTETIALAKVAPVAAAPAAAATARYATATLNVRAEASATSAGLGQVKAGDKVLVTDATAGSYQQIQFNDGLGWVLASHLSDKAPTAATKAATGAVALAADTSDGLVPVWTGGSLGSSNLDRSSGYAKSVVLAVRKYFPQISSMGGWRPSDSISSDHPNGLAIDIMIPNYGSNVALGNAIRDFFAANAGAFHVKYIIFRQQIWTKANPSWRGMANRGSDTANHMDHVHVSVVPN